METNIVSIHFEHLLRNWVWATKIGLTFSQLVHGCTSTPRGRGVIQRCRLQRHPSMGKPIPQGSPRRGLLPITVGEAGLPDEPTEHECTAVRPQRGRISASMWSTALARAYPTIGAVFCLHCLHQRRKYLKIFGLWVKAKVKANGRCRETGSAHRRGW